jgi:predicted amidohydrolase YtcJ
VLVCYELERVLQALEAIDAQVPIREQRWVVVHVISASPGQIERMQRLGVIATVTPTFMQHATDRFGLHALGAAGTPIRALLDGGVPVALSTDGVPHSMLFATWQALARRDADTGETLGEAGITRRQALQLASVAGHGLSGAEHRRGPLRPGHDADLIVLDGDPLTCPLDALPTLPVDLTIVGGRIVHERPSPRLPCP